MAQIYFLQGNVGQAITAQEQAVAAARNNEMREQMTATLNRYMGKTDRE